MSWKTIATVLSVVFVLVLLQSVMADPLYQTTDTIKNNQDWNNEHYNVEDRIDSFVDAWFTGGLIAIFGIMLWGAVKVTRRERTRGRRGGGF